MPLQNFIWIIMHNKRIEYFFTNSFVIHFSCFFTQYIYFRICFSHDLHDLFSYHSFIFIRIHYHSFMWFIYYHDSFFVILSHDSFISIWFIIFPSDSFTWFIIFSSDSFPWFIYFHVWFFHTIRYSHDILSLDLFTFVCDSCGNSVFKTLDTCLEGYYFHIFSRDSFIPLICQMILSHDSFLYVTHIHWFISFRVWFFQGMSLLLRCDSSTVDFF